MALTCLVPRPALAATPTPQDSTRAAAGWLARQLVDGERFENVFGTDVFWDQGLTLDAILGFAAAGVSGANAQQAIAWLARPEVLANYDGDFDDDPTVGFTAGPLAKVALAAEVTGKDPTDFGGVDLVALLLAMQGSNGRFTDSASFGDSVNAFGQALGVIAVHRTGAHPAAATSAGDVPGGYQVC